MYSVQGYYDGNCVRLLGNINAQKNQKVIVEVVDEFWHENTSEQVTETDPFLTALRNDSLVIPTGLDADSYVEELRAHDRI